MKLFYPPAWFRRRPPEGHQNTEKLAVSVQPGEAVVDGRPYWLTEQAKELAVPAASTSFARTTGGARLT